MHLCLQKQFEPVKHIKGTYDVPVKYIRQPVGCGLWVVGCALIFSLQGCGGGGSGNAGETASPSASPGDATVPIPSVLLIGSKIEIMQRLIAEEPDAS